jgi:hypothetical protein
VLSLCPENVSGLRSPSSAESVTATQVRLLSVSNTLSRLLSGPLADFISPLTPYNTPPRTPSYRISRVMLLSGISLLLAGTFVYLELVIRTPDSFRVLRYVVVVRFEFAHYSMGLSVLAPVLRMVPHSQFCASAFPTFPLSSLTLLSCPDQASYLPSGETVTLGAILVSLPTLPLLAHPSFHASMHLSLRTTMLMAEFVQVSHAGALRSG